MKILSFTVAFGITFLLSQSLDVHAASTSCLPSSLKSRLNQLKSKYGGLHVISAHRKGARIRGSGRRSKHASCKAVDFKIGNKWAAYKWLSKNHNGGVGVYSGNCSHIHIDIGGRARWHSKKC